MKNTTKQITETFESITKNFEMSKATTELLDTLAAGIPIDPPLKPDGEEMTVCEMYPDLTPTEINYLLVKYQGSMKRG